MPGTHEEYVRYAASDDAQLPGEWEDGTAVTDAERLELNALRFYRRRQNAPRDPGPQRKAMRLLRSFLTPDQRGQLRSARAFVAVAPSGHAYRLYPKLGLTERVTTHGRRRFAALRFCLHDDPDGDGKRMPPADLALAHLLWLMADEEGFLATANATNARDQLWNREYLRRLRERTAPHDAVESAS